MQILIAVLLSGWLAPTTKPDTVVVCPAEFAAALKPWIEYRATQGHVIQVVSNAGSDNDVRNRIRAASKASGTLKTIVMIGDAAIASSGKGFTIKQQESIDPDGKIVRSEVTSLVPAHKLPTTVTRAWGSTPEMATDNWYADLDDDTAPDLAIGRLTADSPAELTTMINKIIAYENNIDFGPWRNRVNFVGGAGGFGAVADRLLERAARLVILGNIPQSYTSTMTYACWQSPYCPDPRKLNETVVARLNEGCLFWVFMGHGSYTAVAGTAVSPDFRWNDILTTDSLSKLKLTGGPPIALFMACNTGAYDLEHDCLAEELLRKSDGPVAVLSGSRVTMPFGMTILGLGLMDGAFVKRYATIGEVFLHAKRNLVLGNRPQPALATLTAFSRGFETIPEGLPLWAYKTWPMQLARLAGTVPANLAQERIEHASLFNLFGDPLMRLHHPKQVKLDVAKTAVAGRMLEVAIECPVDGACRVELLLPLGRQPLALPERARFSAADRALSRYDVVYNQANDARVVSTETQISRGRAKIQLAVPATTAGSCLVRVLVSGPREFALGSASIQVEPISTE